MKKLYIPPVNIRYIKGSSMEFGEFFVAAVKFVFAVGIIYVVLSQLAERLPSVTRFEWMIIIALIAVSITFLFGYLMRGETGY